MSRIFRIFLQSGILLPMLVGFFECYAQVFVRRAAPSAKPPKALVVLLLTRQNQRAFLKEHRPELLPEFERDVAEVRKRTIMDFSGYFKVCPVYFVIDSVADKLRGSDWTGVLLDGTLQPVSNAVIAPGERNFYIAYFGSPITQSNRPDGEGDDASSIFREKLIVNDPDFYMLSTSTGPRTNYARSLRPRWMSLQEYRTYRSALTYNADRWYIDYLPVAYSYDVTVRRFFRLGR